MIEDTIGRIALFALPILVAIVFHEVAHGWVANRLGDPTAARMGRLTLNPIAHVDLFGTILLPLLLIIAQSPFLFGYAKPVPVNYYNLNNPKRDMVWVALAGPAMNLLLALVSVLAFKFLSPVFGSVEADGISSSLLGFFKPVLTMAQYSLVINVVLAVFNIFPLPPLDGGRVLVGLLPEPHSSTVARIEPYGFLILLALLMTRLLDRVIGPPTEFLLNLFVRLL